MTTKVTFFFLGSFRLITNIRGGYYRLSNYLLQPLSLSSQDSLALAVELRLRKYPCASIAWRVPCHASRISLVIPSLSNQQYPLTLPRPDTGPCPDPVQPYNKHPKPQPHRNNPPQALTSPSTMSANSFVLHNARPTSTQIHHRGTPMGPATSCQQRSAGSLQETLTPTHAEQEPYAP